MDRSPYPSVLFAALAAAAAWLGAAGPARAGYVPVKCPALGPDTADPAAPAPGAAAEDGPRADRPDERRPHRSRVPLWALAAPGGATQSGTGMPSGPFGSGPGASGQAAGPLHEPTTPAGEAVDRLAPEAESLLPSPYPARLFRPPRGAR